MDRDRCCCRCCCWCSWWSCCWWRFCACSRPWAPGPLTTRQRAARHGTRVVDADAARGTRHGGLGMQDAGRRKQPADTGRGTQASARELAFHRVGWALRLVLIVAAWASCAQDAVVCNLQLANMKSLSHYESTFCARESSICHRSV